MNIVEISRKRVVLRVICDFSASKGSDFISRDVRYLQTSASQPTLTLATELLLITTHYVQEIPVYCTYIISLLDIRIHVVKKLILKTF